MTAVRGRTPERPRLVLPGLLLHDNAAEQAPQIAALHLRPLKTKRALLLAFSSKAHGLLYGGEEEI